MREMVAAVVRESQVEAAGGVRIRRFRGRGRDIWGFARSVQ